MAETKKNGQAPAPTVAAQPKNQRAEVYTAAELTASSEKLFGVPRECVVAAFRLSGKKEMTVSEAKEIVKKFMDRKVM